MATSSRYILLVHSGDPGITLDEGVARSHGFDLSYVHTAPQLVASLDCRAIDAVLLVLPDSIWTYDQLLGELRRRRLNIPVLCYEPHGSPLAANYAVAAGVSRYIVDEMNGATLAEICVEAARGGSAGARVASMEPWRRMLVGDSDEMRHITGLISLVADRRSTILITGETGTGKEVAARAIHAAGKRARGPFVAVNCAALPENLIEAELFGHTRGAYTGAANARAGRFEEADGGTILLDEISDLPLNCQAKLLRVLQEREVQRLGSSETVRVDVRVIAASNTDLGVAVRQRSFREDLLYRLQVVPMRIPPLRERMSDVPALAEHFITKLCEREGIGRKSLAQDALHRLLEYDWPGNVRQLEHAVESAVILSGERPVLRAYDFSALTAPAAGEHHSSIELPSSGIDFEGLINRIQHDLLWQALRRSGGNKAKAAGLLGMKRTTLISKIKALGCAAS